MSKRFTDTEKWGKKFIRGLKPNYKLLWLYILDECNTAGIWDVDIEVAEIKIGIKLNESEALNAFAGKVMQIDGGEKWFIPAFIEFQYGELSENNRAHTKAILALRKYELVNDNLKIKPLTSPLQGAIQGPMVEEEAIIGNKSIVIAESEKFTLFKKWLTDNASRVLKMKSPFTESEYFELMKDFHFKDVCDILLSMHNHSDLLKKNVSANLTFRNWANRRGLNPNTQTVPSAPKQAVV